MAHDTRTPRPGPDSEIPGERRPADEVTGSQTGTIGGGGREGHNPSPVRATGADDDSVESAAGEPEGEFDDEFDDEADEEAADDEESERE